jgi:starvation-inducible DNA-binding protein
MGSRQIEPEANCDEEFSWDRNAEAAREISATLNALLADLITLHLTTKNFQWHVSGPNFRDYQLMFGEQADQIFGAADLIARRVRKIGCSTDRSVNHVLRLARISGNDADRVSPEAMLSELRRDNLKLAEFLRDAYLICADHVDIGSTSLLDTLIDETEGRIWYLSQCMRSFREAAR